MPTYAYRCGHCGLGFDRVLRVADYKSVQRCACGEAAERVISAPTVFVQADVGYASPVDGRPITSRAARLEDMRRAGCVEYDPGMRQDYQRRIDDGERALDAKVDAGVDRAFATMPAAKIERLANEVAAGLAPEVARSSAPIATRTGIAP